MDLLDPLDTSVSTETVSIYALVDPRSGLIRYIGKAVDPEARVRQHLQPAQLDRYRSCKNSWLKGLLAGGFAPSMFVVEAGIDPADANDAERYWIRFYRECGFVLTNGTDGGDGGAVTDPVAKGRIAAAHHGRKDSEETKSRRRASQREAFASAEFRAKRSAISKKLGLRPPVLRGVENVKAYLSDEQVREVREKSASGLIGTDLAKEYGTTPATISNLVTGKFRLEAGGPIRASRSRRTHLKKE